MSTNYVVPDAPAVTSLLGMMYGEDLKATDGAVSDFAGQYVATFISDDDQLVALCACDKAFVAYSGAALSMIPAGGAQDMVEGEISETVFDNYHEVMNICSKLLMSETSAHLRLDKALAPEQAADAVAALEPVKVLAFDVDIPGYGTGALSFSIT